MAVELAPGGLTSVRIRRWRWTAQRPHAPGWYAMRWSEDRRQRTLVTVTREHVAAMDKLGWLDGVEWSSTPMAWPLEMDAEDDDPTVLWERGPHEAVDAHIPYADEVAFRHGDLDAPVEGFSWGHVRAGAVGFTLAVLAIGVLYAAVWFH